MMKKELRQSDISMEPEPKDNNYITKTMIMDAIHELLKDDKESINLLLNYALKLKNVHSQVDSSDLPE